MTDLDTLALMLRPAGGGVHTVSTGREEQLALQRRLYGAADGADVQTRWRDALARIATARVAILAIPSDTGAGLVRGAAFGPAALRASILELLPDFPERAERAGIVDVGDVFVVPQLLHDDMLSPAQVAATRAAIYPVATVPADLAARLPVSPLSMAAEVAARLYALNPSLKIFTLGGDHSVAWPVVAALAAQRPRPFAIVHPDAHTDLLPERLGIKYCFATWAYHANEVIGREGRLVQVGVRASGRPRAHWESTLGVRQFWAEEVARLGEAAALDELVAHLQRVRAAGTDGSVYLSNDIDGTDGVEAPATGAPEPGGLSVAFVRALIRRLGKETSLVGADLVEVAPTVGAPEAARRTVEIGATYVLDSLAALSGSTELET
jgi:arginase family enzyme